MGKQLGYGFFIGGDPRDFTPDPDCCSEKEMSAWKESCEQWNSGVRIVCKGSHRWLVNGEGEIIGSATVSGFGIGTYVYDEEDEL